MTETDTPKNKIEYSDKLRLILQKLDEADDYVAFELLWLGEPNTEYYNEINIGKVDISMDKDCFLVYIDNKPINMRIYKFVKYYFSKIINNTDIFDFIKKYNSIIDGKPITGNLIVPDEFVYNPLDVRNTFISLVTKTYPHGHESELLNFLPKLNIDIAGNYYKIIGNDNPNTMFCCHLDTADRKQSDVKLYSQNLNDEDFILTDGKTILGSDDKAGTAVMLYMIEKNIPGLYYFFIGEERGGIGSTLLSISYDKVDYLNNIKRCIAFDRRDVKSVITHQLRRQCCSDAFGNALCSEYNKYGINLSLDRTGVYTDSASFIDNIPECTNISVGYYSEHTTREKINITYLEKLAKASVKVNWDSLPVNRNCGIDPYFLKKYGRFISEFKKIVFPIETKILNDYDDKTVIQCDLEYGAIDETYDTLTMLQSLLDRHNMSKNVYFEDEYLKIELKR